MRVRLSRHAEFVTQSNEKNICNITRDNFKIKEYFRKERRKPQMSEDFNISQYVDQEVLDKLKHSKHRERQNRSKSASTGENSALGGLQERRRLLREIVQNTATEQQLLENQRNAQSGKRYRGGARAMSGSTTRSGGNAPAGGDDSSSVASAESARHIARSN